MLIGSRRRKGARRRPLLHDHFGKPLPAGSLNGSLPVPGPAAGTRTVTDTESLLSISPWVSGASLFDETGASFGPENNRCSYYPGQSWIGFAGVDFSAAPLVADRWYLVKMEDTATGAMAFGYVKGGDVGPGEALGSELVTNGDFSAWTGDNPDGWTVVNEDANNYVTEDSGKARIVSNNTSPVGLNQLMATVAKKLYKNTFDVTINTLGWQDYVISSVVVLVNYANRTSAGTTTRYLSAAGTNIRHYFYRNSSGASDYTLDNYSLREITAPSATCAYVYPYPGAPATGWAGIAGNFNMNASAYTFDVYEIGEPKLVGVGSKATVAWGDPGLWYPAITRELGKTVIFGPVTVADVSGGMTAGLGYQKSGILQADAFAWMTANDNFTAYDFGAGYSPNLYSLADNTPYYLAIRLLAAGAEYYIRTATGNWKKLWRGGTNATATLYPGISNYNTQFTLGKPGVIIPAEPWFPPVLLADTFTRADGAVGSSEGTDFDGKPAPVRVWSGSGAAVSGNALVITPELGEELVTNGDFSAWTGDDPDGWAVIPGEAAGYYVTEDSGKARLVSGGTYIDIRQSGLLSVGSFYQLSIEIVANTGLGIYLGGADSGALYFTSSLGVHNPTIRANNTYFRVARTVGGAVDTTFDNVSVKQISFPTTLATADLGTSDVMLDTNITRTAGTQAGIALNVDDESNPQNMVLVYLDGVGNCVVDKLVNGTWSTVASTAITYAADAQLRVVKDGTGYSVFYNGSLVGSTNTISDATVVDNTIHGLFSTYEGNSFSAVSAMARGSNGEYNALNRWIRD